MLAVYLGGSLAKGDHDLYSDIDLRIVVKSEAFNPFVREKRNRPLRWGDVVFFEDPGSQYSFTVAHFDCFVKMDIFYYKSEDLRPSLWMQDIKILYDPQEIVQKVHEASKNIVYTLTVDEYEQWRTKVWAYMHEIYRKGMRGEISYALKMFTGLTGYIVQGWNMEAGRFPSLWSDWSRVEGPRSPLAEWQLALLDQWHCQRDVRDVMSKLEQIIPELLRINRELTTKLGIHENKELWDRVIRLI